LNGGDAMAPLLSYPLTWQEPPPGRVLVLAPHPDDEVLSCGGVLALHARRGDEVRVVIATDGAAGDPEGRYPLDTYVELRRDESRAAAAILGTPPPEFWSYPDQGLASCPDLAEKLRELLEEYRPEVVYRPPDCEMHPDHYALAAAFAEAARAATVRFGDYAFDSWVAIRPTHVIDISSVWEQKRAAAEQFKSQLFYNDYVRAVAGLNAFRSIFLPFSNYVEAFEQVGSR
jgi:LmbE family N-acetylglucosaminyl deacetylase